MPSTTRRSRRRDTHRLGPEPARPRSSSGSSTTSGPRWPRSSHRSLGRGRAVPGPSLRWTLTHMIEETGRHAGHADILRELIDGATGH
jgi:hypothetical protein